MRVVSDGQTRRRTHTHTLTDDVQLCVEDDRSVLVGGFALINCRVAEHHVLQDQDSVIDAASSFFVYGCSGRMREDSELRTFSVSTFFLKVFYKQTNNSLTT